MEFVAIRYYVQLNHWRQNHSQIQLMFCNHFLVRGSEIYDGMASMKGIISQQEAAKIYEE